MALMFIGLLIAAVSATIYFSYSNRWSILQVCALGLATGTGLGMFMGELAKMMK